MKRLINSIWNNILLILTLFLLAFIPLYPKIPLLDVENTWVYVRAEDLVVSSALTLWIFLILFKKVKLKTPLTIPVFLFWLIGAISTFHGVLLIFPTLPNVFQNVAFLSLLRRVEYLSLFFIAFAAVKDKKFIYPFIGVLTITLLLIVFYGVGQKLFGFPAYLTGNEEFAKGTPIKLSSLARVPATFAGHYDLGAYLVMVIPIFTTLAFAFKNFFLKLLFFLTSILGFGLLLLTVSRVSFFALLLSLLGLLILARKRLLAFSLLFLAALFLILSPNLLSRFQSTLSEANVLINAKTGEALSQVREVPRTYFKGKTVLREYASTESSRLGKFADIMAYESIPDPALILVRPNAPTGENLPQGTGYVNLELSPVIERSSFYFTEDTPQTAGEKSSEIRAFNGDFLVKTARAYDLSFTTRFQGEWPKTIDAFKRNIFLGSGYGSIGLAVDNDYLRLLGESGILGFISFASIFLIAGIYIKRSYPNVDSQVVRLFVLGFIAGTFGLLLNALLIDVFEASKVAFSYWILMGVSLGILNLYNSKEIDVLGEIRKIIVSPVAVTIYIFTLSALLLLPMIGNFYVGDDFTWLRWSAQSPQNFLSYFIDADGFFYRPAARLYFLMMYKLFWLNQTVYHLVSILLHSIMVLLVFLTLRKILKSYLLAIMASTLFLLLSSYHEALFWISSTGILFATIFSLLSLLSFVYWREKKEKIYLAFFFLSSLLSPMFHEFGVVTPLIIIVYDLVFFNMGTLFKKLYLIIILPLFPYLILRIIAGSHWFSGDYSYNILKLPFNVIGNSFGYALLHTLGPQSLGFYESLRGLLRDNIVTAAFATIIFVILSVSIAKIIYQRMDNWSKKLLVFGFLLFLVSLLPFLGLGNITSRYSYLSSVGFVVISAVLVKKALTYFLSINDRYTTWIIIALLSLIFLSVQLFQLQKVHSDWKIAGDKVKTFLVSFEANYKDHWKGRHIDFYFVNVPIKNGEAWVFPVGLEDALYFTLINQSLSIHKTNSASAAFSQIMDKRNSEVLEFDEHGRVSQALEK